MEYIYTVEPGSTRTPVGIDGCKFLKNVCKCCKLTVNKVFYSVLCFVLKSFRSFYKALLEPLGHSRATIFSYK